MIRETLAFAAAFGVCAALGTVGVGCSDSCDCREAPQHPEPPQTLPITDAVNFDRDGNDDALEIDPTGGTFEITSDSVVIRYEEAGVDHTVVYAVTGPAW